MRIAIFHNIPSGGAKRVVYEHAKELVKTEEVDLYYLSYNKEEFLDSRSYANNSYAYKFNRTGQKSILIYLAWIVKLINYIKLSFIYKQMANDIDKRSYDIVYIHQCEVSHMPPLAKHLKTPTIVFCQEPIRMFYEPKTIPFKNRFSDTGFPLQNHLTTINDILQKPFQYILKLLDKRNIKCADLVLANSYYSREYIYKAYGIFSKVNYLGVDTEKFSSRNKKRENTVLAVGAIDAKKGYDFIIKSLSLINNTTRPIFIIVADRTSGNSDEQYLINLAKEKNIALQIRSNISENDLVDLYNSVKAVAYAPIMEPFGLVAIEAMACGTPIIGIKEAGLRESIVDQYNGLLTDRDPQEFSSAIEKLLTNDALWQRLHNNCRRSVLDRFTWEKSIKQLLQYFNKLIK